MTMTMSGMKTLVFDALFYAIMIAGLHGTPGAQAETISCDDAPGMEGCSDEITSSSSSKQDVEVVPTIMKLLKSISYDQPTFYDVYEDTMIVSDDIIYTLNMHFTVHEGVTLTFRAPAVKIARNEASVSPLFELSGTVKVGATGSTPVLLDGSSDDVGGIVEVMGDHAAFMSDQDSVVRYYRTGITVSRMPHMGRDLDDPHYEEVDLRAGVKPSLAAYHVKREPETSVPSSGSTPSSTTTSPYSSPPPSYSSFSSSTPEMVGNDGDDDVCVLIPDFDVLDRPGSCPNPAFSPANTTATPSPGDTDKVGTHASASGDCNGNTSSGCTSTKAGGDINSNGRSLEHDHDHDNGSSGINSEARPDQAAPTTAPAPPTPTTCDLNPSFSISPKHVLTVGDSLTGSLVSSTGKSAIWTAKHGSIVFGEIAADTSNALGVQKLEDVRSSILVYSEPDMLKRVAQARVVLRKERLEGRVVAHESCKRPWGWGWVPCRSHLVEDVERARGRVGKVEMTLTDRGGVVSQMLPLWGFRSQAWTYTCSVEIWPFFKGVDEPLPLEEDQELVLRTTRHG